jgi:LytS/YehU family sensor histidine kinase
LGPALAPFFSAEPGWSSSHDIALFLNTLMPYAIVSLGYAHWRDTLRTRSRLSAARLGRAQHEQHLQASRLLALQARVDPQLLFDTLRRIRAEVNTGGIGGEAILNDLITLLRTMQPHAAATSSSLVRELDLLRAYGRVAQIQSLIEPELQLQCHPDTLHTVFAPMLLLPLLRELTDAAPASRWRLGATHAQQRLKITVTAQLHTAASQAAFAKLEPGAYLRRLQAVHGASASTHIHAAQSLLTLELPYTTAP